jgi:hypothetical protein
VSDTHVGKAWPAFAFAVTVLVVLLGAALVGTGSLAGGVAHAAPGSPRAAPSDGPSNAGAAPSSQAVKSWSHVLSAFAPHLTTADLRLSENLTGEQMLAILKTTPYAHANPDEIERLDAQFSTFDQSLGTYFGGFLAGCAIGATFGAISGIGGGPIGIGAGAGFGCIIGGAAVDLGIYLGAGTANSAEAAVELQFQLGLAAQLDTDIVYTDGLILTAQSVANSTGNAFATMADNAALDQLPNVTFDPLQAINRSGVALQLATLAQDYANALGGGLTALGRSYEGGYGASGGFNTGCSYSLIFTGAENFEFGCVSGTPEWYASFGAALRGSGQNGEGVAINKGGYVWWSCATGAGTVYLDTAGGTAGSATSSTVIGATNPTFFRAPYSAVWVVRAPAHTTCQFVGASFLMVPPQSGTPDSQLVIVGCGVGVATNATPCDPTGYVDQALITTVNGAFGVYDQMGHLQSPTYTEPSTAEAWFVQMNTMLISAEASARTYWAFLHILGYNSSSQIPSGCLIPMPGQELPAQYDAGLGTLTLNQSLSLYEAWMNGLATFFNTPPSTGNFCSGHQPFSVGTTPWNLNTEITGFVLTTPHANQNFGQLPTWAVTNASTSQYRVGNSTAVGLRSQPTAVVIWPTVKTLNVPIGKVQEVPVDDPLMVFVPGNGTLYELYGNGTAAGASGFSNGTVSSTFGAAIYVSTCMLRNASGVYHNAPGAYCGLTLSNIANVTFNVSCFYDPTTGACGNAPFPTGNAACGQTLWGWATLVTAVASVTGTSSLGCLVAEGVAAVILLVVIIVVVYVAVAVYRGFTGGSRRTNA